MSSKTSASSPGSTPNGPGKTATAHGTASHDEPLAHLDCILQATGVRVVVVVEPDEVRIVKRGGNGKVLFAIPTLHILSARYLSISGSTTAADPNPLQITYLGPSVPHNLISLQLLPTPSSNEPKTNLAAFLEIIQRAAYPRTIPKRRVYLIVNPAGGPGKARKMTQKVVLPALEAAGCTVTVNETSSNGQAIEFGRNLDVDRYDVIGCVSGDGILHEVLNGLASRKDAQRGLRLPLVPVPCGSGNTLSVSLHGKTTGFSVALSTLNLIKGIIMPLDLCSVTQADQPRKLSFLSTSLGIMADCDLGTEHLRWMGDARFVYGFLRGAIAQPDWAGSVSMLVEESDKAILSRQAQARLDRDPAAVAAEMAQVTDAPLNDSQEEGLPPLQFTAGPGDEWLRIDGLEKGKEVLYIYAGLTPAASRDLVQWPFVNPGDGLLNVAVQTKTARAALLSAAATTAEFGGHIYQDSTQYYQVHAMYVDPTPERPNARPAAKLPLISVDGEAVSAAHGPLMLEMHRALGRTMSLAGRWQGADEFHKKGLRV